jgi:hypothetical protein
VNVFIRGPVHVVPHLGQEHVHAVGLAHVQDAIERAHLGIVPIEPVALGLIHALSQLDRAPVQPKPAEMPFELLPGDGVL